MSNHLMYPIVIPSLHFNSLTHFFSFITNSSIHLQPKPVPSLSYQVTKARYPKNVFVVRLYLSTSYVCLSSNRIERERIKFSVFVGHLRLTVYVSCGTLLSLMN